MKSKDYMYIGAMTLLIFMASYAVLALLGLVPEEFKFVATRSPEPILNTSHSGERDVPDNGDARNDFQDGAADGNLIPTKVEIAKIGVSATISAPQSVDVATLDAALTKGAVYYPGSGTLKGGNMFLFGHSTNWKVVNNQAYKTFNGLDKLVAGDEIVLTSGGKKYLYSVRNVKLADQDDALVQFASEGRMLTISTCDTFGKKEDRWVVEAEYKGTL